MLVAHGTRKDPQTPLALCPEQAYMPAVLHLEDQDNVSITAPDKTGARATLLKSVLAIATVLWLALLAAAPHVTLTDAARLTASSDAIRLGEPRAAHTPARPQLRPSALTQAPELKRRDRPEQSAPAKSHSTNKAAIVRPTNARREGRGAWLPHAPPRNARATSNAHRPRGPPVTA